MKRVVASLPVHCMCAACVMVAAAAAPALAQQQDAAALIQSAYKKSQAAKTADEFGEVIELCDQALKLELNKQNEDYLKQLRGWSLNRRGESYVEQAAELSDAGKAAEAAELDAKALADFEQSVDSDPQNWKAIHNRGVSYAVAKKLDQAVADFSRVIELRPTHVNAWFNRAEIYYEQGQPEKAVADYSEVIRREPRDFGAYLSRGHAHFEMRQFREAFEDYNRAVELQPRNAEAYTNRGDAHASVGQWRQAAADYRRAVDLDNQNARAYQSAAWLMATCPNEEYRDSKLAVEAAEQALKLAGDEDFKYFDTLAAAQASAGQYDEAQTSLQQAIDKAPPSSVEALKKRMALYKNGQPYRIRLTRADDASSTR